MKCTFLAAMATLLLAFLAACGGRDTAERSRTGVTVGTLSTPTQAPVPLSWGGTSVDLMFADALASCSYEVPPLVDIDYIDADWDDDSYVNYVRGKMLDATCHGGAQEYYEPSVFPEYWWLGQRNDEACNRDRSTNSNKAAGLERSLTALDVDIVPPFGGYFSMFTMVVMYRALGMPVTNLCIAQYLRARSPGVSGGEALLLSAAEQRQILALTKERAQIAMLQFALLGRALATPRLAQPERVSEIEYLGYWPSFIPMLQEWVQGGGATKELLSKLGQDFASAVLLHVTASEEFAQLLTRSGAAHSPRGGSVSDDRWAASGRLGASVDTWGPGAWRERALASLYGGDPLVEDDPMEEGASGSTPWSHYLHHSKPGQAGIELRAEWPDVGDASFVSARVKDPKVHELLSLARQANSLYLKKKDFGVDPMSRYQCRDVDIDGTASYLYRATEAHLRTSRCSSFIPNSGGPNGGACQAFTIESIPPVTQQASFELWTRYRISLEHARELAAHLKDLTSKECRGNRNDETLLGTPFIFWNRGASDFSGEVTSVTLSGADAGEYYHLIDFTLRERGLRETAGLYSRYSSFFIPTTIFPQADPQTLGFSVVNNMNVEEAEGGAEEMRLMGAIPALAATRDALIQGSAEATALVSPACERVSSYFSSAQPALETIDRAIGRSGIALLPQLQVVSSPVGMESIGQYLQRQVARAVYPDGSVKSHDLFVTFDPTQPFWEQIATPEAAQYKVFAVPDDPTIMDLARFPGSSSFGREIEAALANNQNVPLSLVSWSGQSTLTTRIAKAELALTIGDRQWSFIVRKEASSGFVEYAALASHVEKFTPETGNAGQYLAFGGALGDLATSIIATDPSDPAMPAYDGFGLPNVWLPPTDPALFGGNAGEDAVAAYLRKARVSAEEATAAVKEAVEAMLQTQHDEAALAAEVSKSEKVAALERSALCGVSTCTTAMKSYPVSPEAIWNVPRQRTTVERDSGGTQVTVTIGAPPDWDDLATDCKADYASMSAATRLDCVAMKVLTPHIVTPAGAPHPWSQPAMMKDFNVSLLEPVVAAHDAQTAPSFSQYQGGALQAVAVEQWTALRSAEDRIRAVIAATDAAIGTMNVYMQELAHAADQEAEMRARCEFTHMGEEYATDWSEETSTTLGESNSYTNSWSEGGSIVFFSGGVSVSETKTYSESTTYMTDGERRRLCESYRDKVSSTAWRSQEALIQATANIQSRAADFSEAMGRLKAASAAGYGLQHQTDLAVARGKLEVELLRRSQTTSFGLYRQIHSYDAWRAKSLLESARLGAAVARKAIESRFMVNLSELKAPEPLVASPSSWADEVYEYDLDAPAAVGLSVGESVSGGIYTNRLLDYVGNLERFVNGYSIARPTTVAHDDTEVVSIPGTAGLDSGMLPGTVLPDGRAFAWSYLCPDGANAGWRPAPRTNSGTNPSGACGPPPARPTRASILFVLDSWGRLHGDIADEPFEKRYNARWARLALNLVGTGILDCSKARDPGACYTQPFIRYRLAHRPPALVPDDDGSWRLMPIPTGRIEGAKALAAEQWLDPISNAWSKPFVTAIARDELTSRPLGGSYEIEFDIGPEVVLERIQRVQLLAGSSYWVKQN